MSDATPTLHEWAGNDALDRLTAAFSTKGHADNLLAAPFEGMDAGHPRYVVMWLAEVFGHPPRPTGFERSLHVCTR